MRTGLKRLLGKDRARDFATDAAGKQGLSRHYAGVHAIPVRNVVGSVGRAHSLHADFRPIQSPVARGLDHRFLSIREIMQWSGSVPPIDVYQLGDRFYVVDGNHRVAAAKAIGQLEIDATVVEFRGTCSSTTALQVCSSSP